MNNVGWPFPGSASNRFTGSGLAPVIPRSPIAPGQAAPRSHSCARRELGVLGEVLGVSAVLARL